IRSLKFCLSSRRRHTRSKRDWSSDVCSSDLKNKGISVTQATISRDIKELKLIKVPAADGGYRYSLPAETTEDVSTKLEKLLKDEIGRASCREGVRVLVGDVV